MSSDVLIARYIRYRTKRAQIKARQREELELELLPEAVDLGQSIKEQRSLGKRIDDIGYMIGLKNRTFIYKMLDTYEDSKQEELPITPEIEPVKTLDKPYEIEYTESSAIVKVYDEESSETFTISTYQGIIEIPQEWVGEADRAKRKLYAQITKEINERVESRK